MDNREAEKILLLALKAVQDAARASLPHQSYDSPGAETIKMYTFHGAVAISEDGKVLIDTLEIPMDEAGPVKKRAERFEKAG